MKNGVLILLLALICSQSAFAQNEKIISKLELESRVDYQRVYIGNQEINNECGFKGKFLNFRLDGNITKNLSFSYRQRLNKAHSNQSFFDATDWLHLDYKINDKWRFSFGKQVVAIGGYDYDRAPIDSYTYSEYCNNIACYQLGGSVSFSINENNSLTFQICESPFRIADEDMYAYNLFWSGKICKTEFLSSVNMIEYKPGKFINYISLGVKAKWLELDFMNRAVEDQSFFLKNYTLSTRFTYDLSEKVNVLLMASKDVNKSGVEGDYCVLPGTNIRRAGLGFEYYPLANKSLRIHLHGFRILGDNANIAGTLVNNQNIFGIGLKWNLDLLSFKFK